MLEVNASYVQKDFRSQIRVSEDGGQWRWHATASARDKHYEEPAADAAESRLSATYPEALAAAKARLAKLFNAMGIPAAELAHLDHLK